MFRHFLFLSLVALIAIACISTEVQVATTVSPTGTAVSSKATVSPTMVVPTNTATASPTATRTPTPTSAPTATSQATLTPAEGRLEGPDVSYHGISFTVDPVLGDAVFADTASDSPGYAQFSFAPDGWCRAVGCVIVHPVASYREEILFGDDVVDDLRSAIETQSNSYFPVLMAHILLRAQTQHVWFQSGMGIRAVVMKGQDLFFANNESLQYEFHGLTDDGKYYVEVMFPVAAPILLNAFDPAENTNEAAIPVPELPADDGQTGAMMRAYNEEAERQLDALDSSSFTPDLGALDALVNSLLIEPVGFLEADIDYTGNWYRETFSYTREAENIRHFVLVMPASEVDRATADEVFSSINFLAGPDILSMRAGREEFSWALEYVYEAPEGHFRGEFEPGTYYVAAAFVAAPISKEEAGAPEDTILYAGVTGGGASTDYQEIVIGLGESTIQFNLTDGDGWACPWLHVYNGRAFERRTEILRNVRGEQREQTETSDIGLVEIVDGSVILQVTEEKAEISFIDALYIIAGGVEVRAGASPDVAARVAEKDRDYLSINGGESYEFRFKLPDSFVDRKQVPVTVVVSGFYAPLE
jgi:hypothetical protein